MRKKIIALLLLLVITLFGVLYLCSTPKSILKMDFESDIIVQGGVAQTAPIERVFEIPKDGEYIMYTKWEISPGGMLMACNIVDEAGETVNTLSADYKNSMANMSFKAGEYTMTLTPLTNKEQYKEYFSAFDTSEWDVYVEEPETEFATDGTFHFDFEYEVETNKDMDRIIIVFTVLISVLLAVVLVASVQTGDSMKQNYDERQELARGHGFKYGFYTILILSFVEFTLEMADVYLPMSAGLSSLLCVLLGVGVYMVYCIWKDAYFALNQKAGALMAVFFVIGTVNLIMGVDAFVHGTAIENNQLTIRSINLFGGILMLVICVTLLLKKYFKDREEE